MNILYCYADVKKEWNSAWWRCEFPTLAIKNANKNGGLDFAKMMSIHDLGDEINDTEYAKTDHIKASPPESILDYDVIVLQRLGLGRWLQWAQYWQNRGVKVVLDVDDAYHLMDKNSPTYTFWTEGKFQDEYGAERSYEIPPVRQLWWGGRAVDAVSAPSRVLLNDWKQMAKKTIYVPNLLPMDKYVNKKPLKKKRDDLVYVGWGGSAQHYTITSRELPYIDALNRMLKERSNVRVIIVSNSNIWQSVAENCPRGTILFEPGVPFEKWSSVLNMFDIGIAPLNQRYDSYRSPLKVLEYMAVGIPWVASSGPVYDSLSTFGPLCSSSKQWLDALVDTIDNLEERKTVAKGNVAWVDENWGIDNNVHQIINAYKEVL